MYFPDDIWSLILKYLIKKKHLNGRYILYKHYVYYRSLQI